MTVWVKDTEMAMKQARNSMAYLGIKTTVDLTAPFPKKKCITIF